jgi:hypothetical protein
MGAVFVNERDWPLGPSSPPWPVIASLACHCLLGLSLRGTKQSIGDRTKAWIATALRASQ